MVHLEALCHGEQQILFPRKAPRAHGGDFSLGTKPRAVRTTLLSCPVYLFCFLCACAVRGILLWGWFERETTRKHLTSLGRPHLETKPADVVLSSRRSHKLNFKIRAWIRTCCVFTVQLQSKGQKRSCANGAFEHWAMGRQTEQLQQKTGSCLSLFGEDMGGDRFEWARLL